MEPTVADITKLEREIKELERSIATSKGKAQQLKQEFDGKSIDELKEKLVDLETECVGLEIQYHEKRDEYTKAYFNST